VARARGVYRQFHQVRARLERGARERVQATPDLRRVAARLDARQPLDLLAAHLLIVDRAQLDGRLGASVGRVAIHAHDHIETAFDPGLTARSRREDA
jgi:hypothetical protein